jgi:hypothetical protein
MEKVSDPYNHSYYSSPEIFIVCMAGITGSTKLMMNAEHMIVSIFN